MANIAKDGYVIVYAPGHPLVRKRIGKKWNFVKEHRKIWYDTFGPIPDGYHVHHINGEKKDNRIENLECIPPHEHRLKHSMDQVNAGYRKHCEKNGLGRLKEFNCQQCGKSFFFKESEVSSQLKSTRRRRRLFKFCSPQCCNKAKVKTHCKYGHPFSGDNVKIASNGQQVCITCRREWQRIRRKRKAAL